MNVLADIRIYPVKSLRGASHERATVEPWGLAGDRRWMVVDERGRFLTQRDHPTMATIEAASIAGGLRLSAAGETVEVPVPDATAPMITATVWRDQVPAHIASSPVAALLSRVLGLPCRLVWMHDTLARRTNPAYAPSGGTVSFADAFPVLLTSLGSLDDLNARLATPIPIGRFRPNIIVAGARPWEEDRWRRIRVGEVVFSVVKPCDRCIVTTVDPPTGTRPDKSEPLRTLAKFRRDASGGVMFGQNLVPETTGTIRAGDAIVVLEAGEPNTQLEPTEISVA